MVFGKGGQNVLEYRILRWAQQMIHDTETVAYLARAVAAYEKLPMISADDAAIIEQKAADWEGVAASLAGTLQAFESMLANGQLVDEESRVRAQKAAADAVLVYWQAGGR